MKTMAFCCQNHIQCKLVACSYITQQISKFSHSECNVSYWCKYINIKNGVPESTVELSKER
jgi:hypothetical protein